MKIRGTEHEVKVRSPWAVALLPIITLGIYHLVWWYKINKELKAYGEAKGFDLGQNPTNSLLALFPGGLIIIPALVSYWNGTEASPGRLQSRRTRAGQRLDRADPLPAALAGHVGLSPGFAEPHLGAGGGGATGSADAAGIRRDAARASGVAKRGGPRRREALLSLVHGPYEAA